MAIYGWNSLAWLLGGNAASSNQFLGTINSQPLVFRTNNVERMRLLAESSSLGIGNPNPNVAYALTLTAPNSTQGAMMLRNSSNLDQWHLKLSESGSRNALNFVESGIAENRLVLVPGGNVGIGTATPAARLDVSGSTRTTTLSVPSIMETTAAVPLTVDQQQATGSTTGEDTLWQSFRPSVTGRLERVELSLGKTGTGSVNVTVNVYQGEGTGGTLLASQSYSLPAAAPAFRTINFTSGAQLTADQTYTVAVSNASLLFGYSNTGTYSRGRANISASADVAFRTYMTQPSRLTVSTETQFTAADDSRYALRIINNSTAFQTGMYVTDDGFFRITNNAVGGGPFAQLNSLGNWTSTSDRRMKTDIEPLGDLLEKALQLKPVSYYFKAQDKQHDPLRQMGFIAQDVETLFPSLVSGTETKSLNYAGLSVVAIGALQEMNARMEQQKKRLSALEAENAELKQRLEAIEAALAERTSRHR
jgi:hypothetical protein